MDATKWAARRPEGSKLAIKIALVWQGGHRAFRGGGQGAAGLRQRERRFQRSDIRRHPVGGKAGEQSGDKGIARAGGIHADNRLGAEMGKLLLKGGETPALPWVTSSSSG
jgi:hypothetical protein